MLHKKGGGNRLNHLVEGDINIVPLLDILTTLLFFLLSMSSFYSISYVPGIGMPVGAAPPKKLKPTFTLQVTLFSANKASIWLGSFMGLKIVNQGELKGLLGKFFTGDMPSGFTRNIDAADAEALLVSIQDTLVVIKKSFPHEMKAVLAVSDRVPYQQTVNTLAGLRSLGAKHEAFTLTNFIGQREQTRVLFPQIIVSEWTPETQSPQATQQNSVRIQPLPLPQRKYASNSHLRSRHSKVKPTRRFPTKLRTRHLERKGA